MKWIGILLIALLVSCESSVKTEELVHHDSASTVVKNNISSINAMVGKYLQNENTLEQEPLKSRLSNLMGKHYSDLIKNWNTETPLEREGNVLHASGCKAHDCASISYDLFIDTHSNSINVYQMKNGDQKIYKEDKKITLPENFSKELSVKRQNATLESLPSMNKHM